MSQGTYAEHAQSGMKDGESTRSSDQPVAKQLYMRRFVLGWKPLGHRKTASWLRTYVNYAVIW